MKRSDIINACKSVLETGANQTIQLESKTKVTNARIYVSQFNSKNDTKVSCRVVGNEIMLHRKNG